MELPLLDDPGKKFNYSRQCARPWHHRREGDGARARAVVPGDIFEAARDGRRHAVAADKQPRLAPQFTRVSGRIEPLPMATVPTTPTPPFRGDGGLYSTLDDYGTFVPAAQRRHAGGQAPPERAIGEDDGRKRDRRDLRRTPARRRSAAHEAVPDRRGQGQDLVSDFRSRHDPAMKASAAGSMSWAALQLQVLSST